MAEPRSPGKWRLFLTSLAGILGLAGLYVLRRLVRYARRLWRQPRFQALPSLSGRGGESAWANKALAVAAGNVRDAIESRTLPDGSSKLVLCAGRRNFREPWARDSGFASYGLIELNEWQALRETLELFFYFQTPAGQFPVKIHSTSILDRYLHSVLGREQPIQAPLRPKYKTAHRTQSLDGNALLTIAALNYLRKKPDPAFAAVHEPQLRRAVEWMESRALGEDHLLHQGAFTDWADSVRLTGQVLYTNVLYWKALRDLAKAAAERADDGLPSLVIGLQARADRVRQAIHDHFWQDDLGFFSTSRPFRRILGSAGNLLAIAWGLAEPDQATSILNQMAASGMADPVPTQATNGAYGHRFIALENRLAGIAHYHTEAAWLWLGAWHVIALIRCHRLGEAAELLGRIDEVIVRDEVVHEVYGRDGTHLSTRWYTSEAPLTWNASMVVYAHAVYRRAREGARGGEPVLTAEDERIQH